MAGIDFVSETNSARAVPVGALGADGLGKFGAVGVQGALSTKKDSIAVDGDFNVVAFETWKVAKNRVGFVGFVHIDFDIMSEACTCGIAHESPKLFGVDTGHGARLGGE